MTDGENLTFVASYNMSGLMTDIAEIQSVTSKVSTKTKTLYRLKCTASSYSKWDTYFKIRDLYESYITIDTYKPVISKKNIDEGGYKKEVSSTFNYSNKIIKNKVIKHGKEDSFDTVFQGSLYDLVSSVYHIRTLDYDKFTVGKVIAISVLIDGKIHKINAKYLGTENISVGKYGNKKCYKLSISVNEKELKKAAGSKFIWLIADSKRVPALIKAEIPIGSVQVRLSNM
ncbi:MAG: hypothetical protein A2046_03710 [Bacteroidetes bacterium GWA2_30_7]|nr:MAG: hypothetical protein A2046_03710 [Bacteroidetes bacterium GWA2_30_7]